MRHGSMVEAKRSPLWVFRVALAAFSVVAVASSTQPAGAQAPVLDESCVVSVLNRTAPVDANGVWVLPNVPAGVGQVRLRATCVEDGVTVGGQSDYFLVPPDGVIRVNEIRFDDPAPVAERLALSAATTTLAEPGQVVPLTVLALYPDGTSAEVAPAATGTNYVVSNPAVATVSPDGEVTAVTSGTVIVSALNEGATGFLRLQVVLSGDSDGDGIPDDVEVSLGLDPNDPVDALSDPDGDGLVNRDEVAFGTDPNDPDSDGDGLADGEEVTLTGTDPALFDTDGDGVSDGLEIATGSDPLDPTSFDLTAAMASFRIVPAAFVLNTNAVFPGEAAVALRVEGTLIDGTTLDLTSSARGTTYSSSDLFVCNFGLEDGMVFGGGEGPCSVTATNSGFQANAEGLVQSFTPAPVAGLDLPSYGNSVAVRDGWAFVAGGPGGLHVVDVSKPRQPRIVATLPLPGNANDVVLDGDLAYVAGGAAGLHVVDLAEPWAPILIASVDTPGNAIALRVVADLVYVADGSEGLQLLSIVDPSAPLPVGSWDTPGVANGLAVSGGLAVVSTLDALLELVDVSNPSSPVGVSTVEMPDLTFDVEILGHYAYVATSRDLRVVDLSDPLVPADLGAFGSQLWMIDLLAVGDDRIFTTQVEPSTRMPMFDLGQDPAAPIFAGVVRFSDLSGIGGDGLHLAADEHFVYMTASVEFEVDSKPGTTGRTRLLIAQHAPFEDPHGEPPQVSIVAPQDGDEVSEGAMFQVEIAAADDVGVLDVTLFVDGEAVRRDATSPYRFLVTAPAAPATLEIGAGARDFGANLGEAQEVVLRVVAGQQATSVAGRVQTTQGEPVAGASVFTSMGGQGATAADGTFRLDGIPVLQPALTAFATASEDGVEFRGRSASTTVAVGGVTDVGTIILEPLGVPYPGARTSIGFRNPEVKGLAAADFDQDGVLDLVGVSTPISATTGTGLPVSVLLGRGDGSFEELLALPGGMTPKDIEAEDLNLDGFLDLAVANSGSFDVRIYLGRGDGTFESPTVLPTSIRPSGLAIGDLDRDLVPDLVAVGEAAAATDVLVFLGRGDGTFGAPATIAFPAAPDDVRLADFDGDGKLDLATRDHLTVALGNGDGTFQGLQQLLPGSVVFDQQVGDLNGDGLADVLALEDRPLIGERGSAFLSRGDGTFEQVSAWSLVLDARGLALGDLNLDGILDAVVENFDGASLAPVMTPLLGDGTGRFVRAPVVAAGDQVGRPLIADFDEDGSPDLAVAGRKGVTVLAGAGTGGFRTYLRDRAFRLDSENPPAAQLVIADLDLDGIDDLLTTAAKSVRYYFRNLDGSVGPRTSLPLDELPQDLIAVDLTSDGAPEIIAVGSTIVSIFRNNGAGTFSGPEEQLGELSLKGVVAADVTGDGFIDLVTVSAGSSFGGSNVVGVLENDGNGSFAAPRSYATGSGAIDITTLDLDLDGDLDLATLGGGRLITLLGNDGAGSFSIVGSLQVALAPGDSSLGPAALKIEAGDLDGDGLWDLVTANVLASSVSVFLGMGDGEFSPDRRFAVGTEPRDLVFTDVDRDGVLDLLTLNAGSNDVSWLRGIGDGTFAKEQRFATDERPRRFSLIDADGDGLRDDLVVGTDDRLNFLLHQ